MCYEGFEAAAGCAIKRICHKKRAKHFGYMIVRSLQIISLETWLQHIIKIIKVYIKGNMFFWQNKQTILFYIFRLFLGNLKSIKKKFDPGGFQRISFY